MATGISKEFLSIKREKKTNKTSLTWMSIMLWPNICNTAVFSYVKTGCGLHKRVVYTHLMERSGCEAPKKTVFFSQYCGHRETPTRYIALHMANDCADISSF